MTTCFPSIAPQQFGKFQRSKNPWLIPSHSSGDDGAFTQTPFKVFHIASVVSWTMALMVLLPTRKWRATDWRLFPVARYLLQKKKKKRMTYYKVGLYMYMYRACSNSTVHAMYWTVYIVKLKRISWPLNIVHFMYCVIDNIKLLYAIKSQWTICTGWNVLNYMYFANIANNQTLWH